MANSEQLQKQIEDMQKRLIEMKKIQKVKAQEEDRLRKKKVSDAILKIIFAYYEAAEISIDNIPASLAQWMINTLKRLNKEIPDILFKYCPSLKKENIGGDATQNTQGEISS